MTPRYAVYYAPPIDHPLWRAGCEWLGRDPAGPALAPPARAGVSAPWRYGFHATLKPPMRLADGRDEEGLRTAVAELARRTPAFEMPALQVQTLRNFLALRPAAPVGEDHPLRRLADACVTDLDTWRAPPTDEELQRRRPEALPDEERALLQRYGYPHVLAHWRFHMTLSDSGADTALHAPATAHFAAALAQPLACDALSLFVEPAPGQPFRLAHRFALA
jgi:putative phosphonate metabolism protein